MEENNKIEKKELKKMVYDKMTSYYLEKGYSVSGLLFFSEFKNLFKVSNEDLEEAFKELLLENKIYFRDTKGGPSYYLYGDIRKNLIEKNNLIERWKKSAMNRPSYSMGISTGMYCFEEELECSKKNIVCYKY